MVWEIGDVVAEINGRDQATELFFRATDDLTNFIRSDDLTSIVRDAEAQSIAADEYLAAQKACFAAEAENRVKAARKRSFKVITLVILTTAVLAFAAGWWVHP